MFEGTFKGLPGADGFCVEDVRDRADRPVPFKEEPAASVDCVSIAYLSGAACVLLGPVGEDRDVVLGEVGLPQSSDRGAR